MRRACGLLEALTLAERAGASEVSLFADSELVVKQMRGEYKVRHPDLIPLAMEARRRASGFSSFSIEHVPRERNKDADRLVNRALNLGDDARVEELFDTPAAAE